MRHAGRHQQERAFVQARHELLPDAPPDEEPADDRRHRDHHELPTIGQAPAQDAFVEDDQRPEQRQDDGHATGHEEHVHRQSPPRAHRQPLFGEVEERHEQGDGDVDVVGYLRILPAPRQQIVHPYRRQPQRRDATVDRAQRDAHPDQHVIHPPPDHLRVDPHREEEISQCRQQDQPQHESRSQRVRLGVSQRRKHLPLLRLHGKHGQETDNRRNHRRSDCPRHLAHRLIYQSGQRLPLRNPPVLRHLHIPDDALDEHHPHVHHHPDGDGDTGQRHDVRLDPRVPHQYKCSQHRDGQHARNHHRRPQVEHQHDNHDDTDQYLVRKARLQRADRFLDQPRPVVEGDDGHLRHRPVRQRLLRQTGIHLTNLLLHVVDHLQWVRPVAGNHHAAHGLHTFLVQSAAPRARPDVHESDIGNAHRHPLPDGDDGVLDVRHILHVAQPTDQVFHLVHLHRLGADVEVALLHGVHHVHHRHVERVHRVRVQLYLVLLDKPARGCYFGHALGGGQ